MELILKPLHACNNIEVVIRLLQSIRLQPAEGSSEQWLKQPQPDTAGVGGGRNAGTVSSCFPEFDREFLNNSEAVSLVMSE